MALINVACILAGQGRRVLAIDLDLEAPGISYLLARERPRSKAAKGFVDLIYDLLRGGERSALLGVHGKRKLLTYTAELALPEKLQTAAGGTLRIMPAGQIDENYEERRQAIDIHRLYREKKGEPIILYLRSLIENSGEFDYVLIDSRTGFADEAGISVRELADHLVILHGLNHQNIEGTARFLERFRRRVKRAESMNVAFVASPIPLGEDDLCDERIRRAELRFRNALQRPVRLDLQIPYHPRLALDETPFIFRRTQGALHLSYSKIEARVREFNNDTVSEWSNRVRKFTQEDRPDEVIHAIERLSTLSLTDAQWLARRAAEEHKGQPSFLNYWEFWTSRFGRDKIALSAAVDHFKRLKQQDRVETLYAEMLRRAENRADVHTEIANYYWHDRRKLSRAHHLFKRAIRLSPNDARILCNFGDFLVAERQDLASALRFYRRAIKASPKYTRAYRQLASLLARRRRYAEAERQYRLALRIEPEEPWTNNALGWFLGEKGKLREAERLLRKAVELSKRNSGFYGTLANFLWLLAKKPREAKQVYQRVIAIDPSDANNAGNFAAFQLVHGAQREANKQIAEAWNLAYHGITQVAAEVAFYRALVLRSEEKDNAIALGYLKHMLKSGFERGWWRFDDVLQKFAGNLDRNEMIFYRALSQAILDQSKISRLERLEHWQIIKAKPLGRKI